MWGHLFIFISTIASLYIVYKEYSTYWFNYRLFLLGAGVIWLLSQVIFALQINALQPVPDILLVLSNAALLTSFLILIRIMKPEFYRYPYQIVYVPFILPVAYLTVLGSPIMQSVIFFSMQFVSLSVYTILCIGYWDRLNYAPKLPIASIILLMYAFLIYWLFEDFHSSMQIIWQIFISLGMIFSVYTFSGVINLEQKYKQEPYK